MKMKKKTVINFRSFSFCVVCFCLLQISSRSPSKLASEQKNISFELKDMFSCMTLTSQKNEENSMGDSRNNTIIHNIYP